MALLLAPYSNAMRLGQGFNSYTQQICVDDAVVIDPSRAENIVTNDGTTMRIAAELNGKPSAWNRIREVVKEGPTVKAEPNATDAEPAKSGTSDDEKLPEPPRQQAIEEPQVETESAQPAAAQTSSEEQAQPAAPQTSSEKQEAQPAAPQTSSKKQAQPAVAQTSSKKQVGPVTEEPAASATTEDAASEPEEETDKAGEESSESGSLVQVEPEAGSSETADAPTAKIEEAQAPSAPAASLKTNTAPEPAASAQQARNRSSSVGNKQSVPAATKSTKSTKFEVAEVPSRQPKQAQPLQAQPHDELAAEEARLEKAEKLERMREEKTRMAEQRAYQREVELQQRKEQTLIREEELKEQQEIRAEKRAYDKARREAAQKAISEAVAKNKDALTLEDLNKIKAQNQFADRFDGIVQEDKKIPFNPSSGRGTSQTVTYSSRFIDKLSDVTEDMCISGALSVKMAKVGGSGRGSFVDSDKFKESDLSFYISVKVVNQTVNFKDALEFNRLRSVDITSDDFNKVYGDSFISGFLEGGEFNALVSMKVHNKAKLLDIKAEAKVALTAGPVDITAEANVGIARTNLEMNTETTIQVSWSGGGNIKPMEQAWNITSIMEAAARFPELVAGCPQRTYAILTKYDTLRSFVALRPEKFSPIQYENAQMYTNVLMDAFMTYKSIYKKLGDKSFSIQNKTLEFEVVDSAQADADKTAAIAAASQTTPLMAALQRKVDSKLPGAADAQNYLTALKSAADISKFDPSLKGISDARKFIRRQMVYIVNEVDLIEKNPKIATDQDHEEPFQSPLLFESRLPETQIPDRLKPKSDPLGGRRIMAKTQTEAELEEEQKRQEEEDAAAPPLYTIDSDLTIDEAASMDSVKAKNPMIGRHLRISTAVPKSEEGTLFNNLDFLFPEWQVEHITIGVAMGRVVSLEIKYDNGLILQKGLSLPQINYKTIKDFQAGERITSVAIEVGEPTTGNTSERVLSICMYTTRGRRLLGQALRNEVLPGGIVRKDDVEYKKAHTTFLDAAFSSGTFKGFFGRLDSNPTTGGLRRVGAIWGNDTSKAPSLSTTVQEVAPIYDNDETSTSATIETFRGQARAAEAQTRSVQSELSAAEGLARQLAADKTRNEQTIRDLDDEAKRHKAEAATESTARQDLLKSIERQKKVLVKLIEYGGRDYTNNYKIHTKVRERFNENKPITLNYDFFEEDPAPGVHKKGTIRVWSPEKNEQTFLGNEGESFTFL